MTLRIWSNLESRVSSKGAEKPPSVFERQGKNAILDKKGKVPRCCLCSKKMTPGGIVIEERPTAEDGSMQKWFYCPSCWIELRRLREPAKDRKRFVAASDSSLGSDLDE